MVKKRLYQALGVTAALVAGGFLYSAVLGGTSVEEADFAEAQSTMQEGTLVVKGTGNVSVEPDLAQLRLGVEATDTSADAAQNQVSERMNAVREQLSAYDIPDENIETASFGVHTDHSQEGEEQFRARHILSVEYSDIENVGELLDDVAAAGANQIQQTRFTLEDESEAEQQALQQAIENTAAKAEAMAESAGKSSGDVLQIAESGTQMDLPSREYAQEEAADSAGNGGTSIEAGQVEVIQEVDVVYQLN
ncbi:SIMPL domain-containing protein [Salibacterium aidingense]|uniref:SIMPL domain-containing protein n=1 Tax=Salibacterium aidingense TaxID=384933 RepID=UPI003BEE44EA